MDSQHNSVEESIELFINKLNDIKNIILLRKDSILSKCSTGLKVRTTSSRKVKVRSTTRLVLQEKG